MDGKHWYLSKTLWINVLALIALVLESNFGYIILDAETQAAFLLIINLFLRMITGQPLQIKSGK